VCWKASGGREAPVAAGSTSCPLVVDDGGLFRTAKVSLREIEGQPRARVLNQIPHAQPSLAAMVAAGPDGLNLMSTSPNVAWRSGRQISWLPYD
jgi:hypothetical protein